jgi:hypothetical protein
MERFINWIDQVDRRVIYVMVLVGLMLPLVWPLGLPVGLSPVTRQAFDLIERLQPGDIAIISPDFTPGTEAENLSQTVAFVHHLMRRRVRIIGLALVPDGIIYAERVLLDLAPKYGYEYGRDFVIMPWKAGGESLVVAMGRDFQGTYPEDFRGRPTRGTLVDDVVSIRDVDVIISIVTGESMTWYIRQIQAVHGVPVTGGATAVVVPTVMPFIAAGQLIGVLTGLKGAAEYELLIGVPGVATAGMDAQTLSHLITMAFILLGNVAYLYKRKNRARRA